MVRGRSFAPDDGAELAHSWREASTRHDEQNSPMFWSGVTSLFENQIDQSNYDHISESLLTRWSIPDRQVQKNLAAEKTYHAKPVSGETDEDALQNITPLYCRRGKKVETSGNSRDGAPLRSLQAVKILRSCLKLGGGKWCKFLASFPRHCYCY